MVTVAASVGTPQNPLVTISHLRGAFSDVLRSDVTAPLENSTDIALNRLQEIYIAHAGLAFAPRMTQVSLSVGDTITITTGASFTLTSGSATIAIVSGEVVNVSTGQIASSGMSLMPLQRYFGTENTTAVITASAASVGYVDGFHSTDGVAAAPLPFRDVNEGDWFRPAVQYVFDNGLFAGTAADTFSPNTPMTRGMFVTVLHRLDGLPPVTAGSVFTDVHDPGQFYHNAVLWANANGIVTGVGDGRFAPGSPITREQMAAIMHRYAMFRGTPPAPDADLIGSFADAYRVSDFAHNPMNWAVGARIMQGFDGLLFPRNTATRAQVAQIIYNFNNISITPAQPDPATEPLQIPPI